MKKTIITLIFMLLSSFNFAKPKIGITMLPYYSFVANIVGDKMEVVPLVPENVNAHTYDATAQDIKRLSTVDIIVVNGVGHDEFVDAMLQAVKKDIKIINANKSTELLYIAGQKNKNVINPHTFISVTQSIQQINQITAELEKLDKENAKYYRDNAMKYIRKIRKIKTDAIKKIKNNISNISIATTHGGYDYILNEFGLSVSVVVEPSYVQSPSISDIKVAIEVIKSKGIKILFDEKTSNQKLADTIYKETGVYIASLNHMTDGAYKKEAFEKALIENMNSISNAILKISK